MLPPAEPKYLSASCVVRIGPIRRGAMSTNPSTEKEAWDKVTSLMGRDQKVLGQHWSFNIYNDPKLAYTYALALARSQQPVPAKTVLSRLLEMPLPAEAFAQVCQVYSEMKDTAGAERCRQKAAAAAPDSGAH